MTERDLEDADVVLCMDSQHMAAVARLAPQALPKAGLIAGEGIEIPDPHHESDEFFNDVARRVESAVRQQIPGLVARISARLDGETRHPSP
jgi:protein-tyrosine-phosphatase